MRREHFIEQSYIDWLKSLGCVFYAPLDQQNGLTDLISGNTGTVQYNNTCVWDSTAGAYLFTKDSSYNPKQGIVIWQNLGMDIPLSNPSVTFLAEINISRFGTNWNGSIQDDANSTTNFSTGNRSLLVTQQNTNITKNIWNKWAVTYYAEGTNRYLRQYIGGVEKYYYDYGATSNTITSNDINTFYANICQNNRGYTDAIFYAKNAMLFNRRLSQQEIREVQGL